MHTYDIMKFEWNIQKAESNFIKHGVSFEDATKIFLDERRLIESDERFNYGEERLIVTGHIDTRLSVVVYVERAKNTVRIISARKANKREQRDYDNC